MSAKVERESDIIDAKTLEALPRLQKVWDRSSITFTEETAREVLDALTVDIDESISEVAKYILESILRGNNEGQVQCAFLSEAGDAHITLNRTLLFVAAVLWEVKNEIRCVAARVAASSCDDLNAKVGHVNHCLRLIRSAPNVVGRLQSQMYLQYLLQKDASVEDGESPT